MDERFVLNLMSPCIYTFDSTIVPVDYSTIDVFTFLLGLAFICFSSGNQILVVTAASVKSVF